MVRNHSHHLINEPPLLVLPSLAKHLGINHAIFLQQMHYWLRCSKHVHDGHRWVYNTYADWQQQMPWLTVRGVRKIINDLETGGYIVSGTFNRMAFDKTKWYRINYDALNWPDSPMCHEMPHGLTETADDLPEKADDASQNVTSDVAQSDTPIPETTQETTDIHTASAQKRRTVHDERFDQFWFAYPKKRGKDRARRWWMRERPSQELTDRMIEAIRVQQRSKEWTKDGGQYIPHPATWLNDGAWEDELTPASDVDSPSEKAESPNLEYFGTDGLKRRREEYQRQHGGGAS